MIWEIDERTQTVEGLDASGRPDPAYAAALGLLQAPPGRRALSFAFDVVLWAVVQLPFCIGALPLLLKLATGSISLYGLVNHPSLVVAVATAAVTAALTLALCVVQLVLHGRKGLTIGKAVFGIRSVNVRMLGRPGVGAVLLRFVIVWASGIVPLAGPILFLVSPMLDRERRGRGWHDKATKVWLVDVRGGLHPYDEKRMRVARKMVRAEPMPERPALPSLATPVDPAENPGYRLGSRVSAGVLGVARPYEPRERPTVGLLQPTAPADVVAGEVGKPVLGGYRAPDGTVGAGSPVRSASTADPAAGKPPQIPAPPQAPAAPVPASAPPAAAQPRPAAGMATADASPVVPPQPPSVPRPPQDVPLATTPAADAAGFGLRFDTGESILITASVLLGRNPDASAHVGAWPIAVPDHTRSLSKTHLLVHPVPGGLELVDCGSTNGSGLIRNGTEHAAVAGTPLTATDGDVIRLGDREATVFRA